MKLLVGTQAHLATETCNGSRITASHVSDGNGTCNKSSVEIITADGSSPSTGTNTPSPGKTSSEGSSVNTPEGNFTTVSKTSGSSGCSSNAPTERISKLLIQYVHKTLK